LSCKVIGVGLACLDYLLQVPALELVPSGCRLQGFKQQGGGMVATAMVAVARLGGRAELWTVLGRDLCGDVIIEGLAAETVDLSQVIRWADQPSPFAFVLVDGQTGERVFLTSETGWGSGDVNLDVTVDLNRIDAADALLVDGHWRPLALPALERARAMGVPICGDIGRIGGNEDLLPLIDYLVVPRHAAEEIAGEAGPRALETLASFGAQMVVITLGAEGATYVAGEGRDLFPAFDVRAVDTTGAGDVFHGAFAYGVAQGWKPRQLVVFSSAVAALKCTQLGGRTGIPSLAQVHGFLTERLPGEDLSWLGVVPYDDQGVATQ
jgi:sulfofructose kinase